MAGEEEEELLLLPPPLRPPGGNPTTSTCLVRSAGGSSKEREGAGGGGEEAPWLPGHRRGQQLWSSDASTLPKPESGTAIPCCFARAACSLAETSEQSTREGSSREVSVRVTRVWEREKAFFFFRFFSGGPR